MIYKEAVDWLRLQEDWTEKEICELLNADGVQAIIDAATGLRFAIENNID